MRTRGTRNLRIFPELIDANLSRKEGRRIPQFQAVNRPLANEIRLAAEHLGYTASIRDGTYPRRPWDSRNLVLIQKQETPKTTLLREIAEDIQSFVRPALEAQHREKERALHKKKSRPQVEPAYKPQKTRKRDGKVRRRR